MKRASIAVAVLVALTLTGCAAATDEPANQPQTLAGAAVEETATSAPLVAETPAATDRSDGEQQYIEHVRDALRPNNVIPDATDEQLVAAGFAACETMDSGVTGDDITVIEGEERNSGGYYEDSGVIATQARLFLCPA